MRPRLLRPDNFTPPSRTPWGGTKIVGRYKQGLDLAASTGDLVGESWEVSVEPSFPSRFADDDTPLAEAIAADGEAWLGREGVRRHGGQTPLLVKLLDAARNLSVQVHPAEGDPTLAHDESGKPESWYILDTDDGGGLYLGLRDGVQRDDVDACLRGGGRFDELMNFVPVTPGDAFVIPAGTVHAIGAGVTLVEPQFVSPGRRGLTYRYWDWNRRYDAVGHEDPAGRPRELHLERALAVTAWDQERGAAGVDACRAWPVVLFEGPLSRTRLVDWEHFTVERWAGSGRLECPALNSLLALVCVGGEAELRAETGRVGIRRGQSAVIPAAGGSVEVAAPGNGVELLVTHCR